MFWQVDETLLEPIIDAVKLFSEIRWRLAQKAAQGLWIRITGQAGQILKSAIALQKRSPFDAIQAQHNGINQRQSYLGESVALVAPGIIQFSAEPMSQLQHLKKFVEKVSTTIMRQASVITGDFEISGRSSHADPYLTKSDVRVRRLKLMEMPVNTRQNPPVPCVFTPYIGSSDVLSRL